ADTAARRSTGRAPPIEPVDSGQPGGTEAARGRRVRIFCAGRFPRVSRAMAEQRLLAPRLRTPPPGMPERITTCSLPDAWMDEQIQRFGVFAAVGAGLWTFGLVMITLIITRSFGTTPDRSLVGM